MSTHTRAARLAAALALAAALGACGRHPGLPSDYERSGATPRIVPDYTDVTVPPNIAPLHFMAPGADKAVARITWPGGEQTYGRGNKVETGLKEWRAMTRAARGKELRVELFCREGGKWTAYKPFSIKVARDSVDAWVSYRTLPPSYVDFDELAIRQRCLESFEESDIYNNRMISEEPNGQCVNCHTYQNYRTDNMMFHMRLADAGTMIVLDGKPRKVNIKTDSMISAAVYASWHPSEKIIAFSADHTSQTFHTRDVTKVEVQESASDLYIYDAERNEVQTVRNDTDELELFPSWSPDGKWLYYCSAHFVFERGPEDSFEMMDRYREIQYNLWRVRWDSARRSFGPPELVYDAKSRGRSAVAPRVSRDGRHVAFAEGPWGLFHVWHPSADIMILDTKTGKTLDTRPMNSSRAESYPSFSSNGRWLLYESRRDDGNYTRLYLAYLDRRGRVHKGFEMPQEDPELYGLLTLSHSRPEFMAEPVRVSPREFRDVATGTPALQVTHRQGKGPGELARAEKKP